MTAMMEDIRPATLFHDVYTGGLSDVGTAPVKMSGTTILAPRILLLLFFEPFVPAIWHIAYRIRSLCHNSERKY